MILSSAIALGCCIYFFICKVDIVLSSFLIVIFSYFYYIYENVWPLF
jgi:hypothetical protein